MPLVVRDLAFNKLLAGRLAIVREVEEVDHARLLLEDCRPARVDDALEPECGVVFLPPMPDENRVRLRERDELELWPQRASELDGNEWIHV